MILRLRRWNLNKLGVTEASLIRCCSAHQLSLGALVQYASMTVRHEASQMLRMLWKGRLTETPVWGSWLKARLCFLTVCAFNITNCQDSMRPRHAYHPFGLAVLPERCDDIVIASYFFTGSGTEISF